MRNKFLKFLIVPLVILSLFFGMVAPAFAQGVTPPTATPQPLPTALAANSVSLFQVSQGEVQLNGPFDSSSVSFGLPATWKLTNGATLTLDMAVAFNVIARQGVDTNVLAVQGGTLTVQFNGVVIGALPLNQVGEVSEVFNIPDAALVSQRPDGRMELSFILDSGISCYVSQQMSVFIHTSSRFSLPHDEVTPNTSLVNFPQPLYQNSVFPESALIVIPDKPTSVELQAALNVAAGLGNLTGNKLVMDLTTIGLLSPEQQANNQIILVGKASSLALLSDLTLPLPVTGGQFKLEGAAADNGVVQMVTSPGSIAQVVMVVSGNTDAGVVKAAQAVTTGLLRPNSAENLAIIEQVQPDLLKTSVPMDQTLADISLSDTGVSTAPGKALKTLRFANVSSASYRFYMPPGETVAPTAYFDLVFGHSALINYTRSGLVVAINGQPIGSIRMSDTTAAQSNNHAQFTIPASVILPGHNRLEIKANLIPNDACTNPQLDGLWATIWPDSSLHLPLIPSQVTPLSAVELSAYPAPFTFQPTLGETAFVLPQNDLETWRSALRVATFLGARTNGALFNFATFFGDELKDTERAKYNLIVIGRATQLPLVADMNASLPAPFDKASDVANESNMQVTFDILASAPAGYVQLLTSPWNQNNLVLAALGNSPQGVAWAAAALVDASLRSRLAGNLAVINGTQVVTTDTRLSPFAQVTEPSQVNTVSGSKLDLTPAPANQPSWILPVIYLTLALILIVLLAVIIGAWMRGRKGGNSQD